jgi:hypothetical protein
MGSVSGTVVVRRSALSTGPDHRRRRQGPIDANGAAQPPVSFRGTPGETGIPLSLRVTGRSVWRFPHSSRWAPGPAKMALETGGAQRDRHRCLLDSRVLHSNRRPGLMEESYSSPGLDRLGEE